MSKPHANERDSPSRWQALVFHAKTRVFQVRRTVVEFKTRPPCHPPDIRHADAPVIAMKRAPLWRELTAEEFPLTAGKVENLRRAALAGRYAEMLDPQCHHLVVSQNLLPHLWRTGALGGRSFDVLIERWPMEELQRRFDRALADDFGHRAWRIDWQMPPAVERAKTVGNSLFFPTSRLGRKGAFELASPDSAALKAAIHSVLEPCAAS